MITLLRRLFPDQHPLRIAAHRVKNKLIAFMHGTPAKGLHIIGVTGSDGKTTTVGMIGHILRASGKRVATVSTAAFDLDGDITENPTQKTSVDANTLQKFIKHAKKHGCTHLVIEASSHGLMQGRLAGIHPEVAVMTNITMEHLDYHKTMEEYIDAKAMLFRMLKATGTKVLNADDQTLHAYEHISSGRTITYGIHAEHADLRAGVAASNPDSISADITSRDGEVQTLSLQIPGEFNIENALAAIGAVATYDVSLHEACEALTSFKGVEGRLEKIDEGQPFGVYVDFTVTPRAYKKALTTLRSSMEEGKRLMVLTGSCGDRMKEKRPLVGEICTRLADLTVITNEDPYTEDPEKIIDDVLSGVPDEISKFSAVDTYKDASPNEKACVRLSNRMDAIDLLLTEAKPGDVLLFAGKGSDVTMMTKGGQIPWNEREILREKLRNLSGDTIQKEEVQPQEVAPES